VDQAVKLERAAAIILGASHWPKYPAFADSPPAVFANSAAALREYLTDPNGFGLAPGRLLDLFESPASASEIHQTIADFLKRLASAPEGPGLSDLIVYYVGHGGFIGPDRRYFFAVRSTAEGIEGPTGLRAADLASTLRTAARFSRKYLILDCCFAAAAFAEFQSAGGLAQLAGEQVSEDLPAKGTALLCAATKSSPAIAPASGTYTMFSGALRQVLRNGSKTGSLHMSLQEIGKEVKTLLREWSPDDWVRPQVLTPDAAEGDVAEVALFPNPAVGGVEIRRLLSGLAQSVAELEKETQTSVRLAGEAGTQARLIVPRVDALETQAQAMDQRVGRFPAQNQAATQRLEKLERQVQDIVKSLAILQSAPAKLDAMAKLVQTLAERPPAPEPPPAAHPIPPAPPPDAPRQNYSKPGPSQLLHPLNAGNPTWIVPVLFFWLTLPNPGFLHDPSGKFLIGSQLLGAADRGQIAYQFGSGDVTSCLVLFILSLAFLPLVMRTAFQRDPWRNGFTIALCWIFSSMAGLVCANLVGTVGDGQLTREANQYLTWMFHGMAAAAAYGVLQGLAFSLLGAFYRVISPRAAIAACGFLTFVSTAAWVFGLTDLWDFWRFSTFVLASSAASAIVLANLCRAIEERPAAQPQAAARAQTA